MLKQCTCITLYCVHSKLMLHGTIFTDDSLRNGIAKKIDAVLHAKCNDFWQRQCVANF